MSMNLKRGDIFLVCENNLEVGSEPKKTRPALIVSNNFANCYAPNVEVAYLTTTFREKPLPTHVKTYSTPRPSVILCESIDCVSKERLLQFFCSLPPNEMKAVNHAIKIALGLIEPKERRPR